MDDQGPLPAPARLEAVPEGLVRTRGALHRLAADVISPARQKVTGRIGLRATRGGFATPVFGDGEQVQVEGTDLVIVRAGREQKRESLDLDPVATRFLSDWYAFGANVLLELRSHAGPEADPSLIQLWPEHFDIALELGREADGARGTYGFSPGDERHPEPYAYVAPWMAPEPGELWRATGFTGAELPYGDLLAAPDPHAAALRFLRERLVALAV